MRKSRFTEQQIIAMIKEHESGMSTSEVCRKHGISDATFYKYKAKFGGMSVSVAQKLKALEIENGRLKRLLAVAMLDNLVQKNLATKLLMWSRYVPSVQALRRPCERRAVVLAIKDHKVSERRAYSLPSLYRTM
ncbi:hypothetical protein PsB1_0614 [Candidatus Phycosocius spiralis]|uniref:Transposase n=1 Tax=Candidatus Phycosocius spiralis TaxID=2815099 RepID=A0ABQ4PTZ3_9PROT|nr:hypothetical protein PsB1_0614 [Candidatus Phycosocius spiralis]